MVDYLEILRLSSDPKNSQRCIASIVHCSRHDSCCFGGSEKSRSELAVG